MVCRFEHSKFGQSGGRSVLENVEETFMADVLFHIIFLYPWLFLRFFPRRQAIHFGSETDEFKGWGGAGLAFHFPQDAFWSTGGGWVQSYSCRNGALLCPCRGKGLLSQFHYTDNSLICSTHVNTQSHTTRRLWYNHQRTNPGGGTLYWFDNSLFLEIQNFCLHFVSQTIRYSSRVLCHWSNFRVYVQLGFLISVFQYPQTSQHAPFPGLHLFQGQLSGLSNQSLCHVPKLTSLFHLSQ